MSDDVQYCLMKIFIKFIVSKQRIYNQFNDAILKFNFNVHEWKLLYSDLKFHSNLFLRVHLTHCIIIIQISIDFVLRGQSHIKSILVQLTACSQNDSMLLLETIMTNFICTRPQRVCQYCQEVHELDTEFTLCIILAEYHLWVIL